MHGNHRPRFGSLENARLAKKHRFDLRVVKHRNLNDLAMFTNFFSRPGNLFAQSTELPKWLLPNIIDHKIEAGLGDIDSHRLSHSTKTNKPNFSNHSEWPHDHGSITAQILKRRRL